MCTILMLQIYINTNKQLLKKNTYINNTLIIHLTTKKNVSITDAMVGDQVLKHPKQFSSIAKFLSIYLS